MCCLSAQIVLQVGASERVMLDHYCCLDRVYPTPGGTLGSYRWSTRYQTRSSTPPLEVASRKSAFPLPMADPFDGLVGHQRQGTAAAPVASHLGATGGLAQGSKQNGWPGLSVATFSFQHQQQQPRPLGGSSPAGRGGFIQHNGVSPAVVGSHHGAVPHVGGASLHSAAVSAPPPLMTPAGCAPHVAGYPEGTQMMASAPWNGINAGIPGSGRRAASTGVFHPAAGRYSSNGQQQHRQQTTSLQQQPASPSSLMNPNAATATKFHGRATGTYTTAQPALQISTSPRTDSTAIGSVEGSNGGGQGSQGGERAEWAPPAEQLHVYESMFAVASAGGSVPGTVSGRAAVQFFSQSGLSKDSLKTVSCCPGVYGAMILICAFDG